MILSGWGRYPRVDCRVSRPRALPELSRLLAEGPAIPRGNGRAYGDSALNAAHTVDMRGFHHLQAFDAATGILVAGAGVQLRDIVAIFVPRGWFLPVTPGTSYVTVGGAIAGDVHGKNHHVAGTFGQHVTSITMMLGTGDVVTTSPSQEPDLFHATCGGMGLTGIILSATIRLIPIKSGMIRQTVKKSGSLEEVCEAFEVHASSNYSVAWVDCLAKGPRLGRSILLLGEHEEAGALRVDNAERFAIPVEMPSHLLNMWTIKAFNGLYYARARHGATQSIPLSRYFYPLDAIGNWNRVYGKEGLVQYQFVLPKAHGIGNMRKILAKIADTGTGSFLAVLKMFGRRNANPLSFPCEGYTFALDFKMSSTTLTLINRLDDMVVNMGGKIYLAKDALMTEQTFKATYPDWERFESVREAYGAIGKLASAQSQRLGLQ